jgi:hypothetical protein
MKIIEEESLKETRQGKIIEEVVGGKSPKHHATSTMSRTHHHITTKPVDQTQGAVTHHGAEEEIQSFRIMIPETHTSIVDIMGKVIAPKLVQKHRVTSKEFSKTRE